MAVKIRLKRMGKIRTPFYRVVVMDSRAKRDGRAIEEIGKYHPTEEPSLIDIDSERALYWLGVGAQPTEQVQALLKVTGDWAKHTGEGDRAGTLRHREARPDKKALYEAALAAADGAEDSTAPTQRRKRTEEPKAAEPRTGEPKAAAEQPAPQEPATPVADGATPVADGATPVADDASAAEGDSTGEPTTEAAEAPASSEA